MKEFEFSSKVKILPWVGSRYTKTSPNILILGESLPGEKVSKQSVIKMVKALAAEEWNYAFFTKIEYMFNNETHWNHISGNKYELDHKAFWDSVAFTEYVQYPLKAVRNRPTVEMWEAAKDSFVEILRALKPDVVIVLGFDNYNHLPEFGTEGRTIKWKGNETETWIYKIGRKTINLIRIQHPSSVGFKQDVWVHLFEVFLKKIAK